MSASVYLVPHDFTEVADKAVYQALRIAKANQGKVALLHVVKSEKDVPAAEAKLSDIIARFKKEFPDSSMHKIAKAGSIFTDIGKVAEQLDAHLIIMGTHGASGMQKVFGSFAVKVISSTHIPFMVVQAGSRTENIERIVFPIDVGVESLQIMDTASFMANVFGAEIHLVAEDHKDQRLAAKVVNRMKVVLKHFKEKNIKYKAEFVKGSGSFQSKILTYGKEIDASLYSVSHDSDKLLAGLDKFTQTIITNPMGRPTLIIHSRAVTSGFF